MAVGFVLKIVPKAIPGLDGLGIVHLGKGRGGPAGQMGLLIVHPDVPGLVRPGEYFNHGSSLTGHPMRAGILHIHRAVTAHPAAGVPGIGVFFLQQLLMSGPADPLSVAEVGRLQSGRHVESAQVGGIPALLLQLFGPAPVRLYRGGGHKVVIPLGTEGIRMPSAEQRLPGRGANRQGRERPGVDLAFRGQTVQCRCFHRPQTPIAHTVMPQLVGVDQ